MFQLYNDFESHPSIHLFGFVFPTAGFQALSDEWQRNQTPEKTHKVLLLHQQPLYSLHYKLLLLILAYYMKYVKPHCLEMKKPLLRSC